MTKSAYPGYEKYFGERIRALTSKTTEQEIKDFYKNWASEYEKDVLQTARLSYHKPMVEYLDVAIRKICPAENKSQIRIIDAGAGTGLVGEALAKLGYTNMDALDISQEMLDEAEKKKVYTKFICAPLNEQRNPDIETGAYHALICVGSLYAAHIGAGALDEMARMVRPGGLLCFNIRNRDLKELYEGKLQELEEIGKCQLVSKETMPYYDNDDLPKETNAFIYKVMKN